MNGQFITTTELREQSSKLIQSLINGKTVNLIYRSKIIAKINPLSFSEKTIEDTKILENLFRSLKPKKIIPLKQRKQVYRKYLKQKYGKNLS